MEAKIKNIRSLIKKLENAGKEIEKARYKYRPIQNELLKKYDLRTEDDDQITNIEDLYMVDEQYDEKMYEYYGEMFVVLNKMGANLKEEGDCPVCIAEWKREKVKKEFALTVLDLYKSIGLKGYENVTPNMLMCKLSTYEKFVSHSLQLFNCVDIKSEEQLKRMVKSVSF